MEMRYLGQLLNWCEFCGSVISKLNVYFPHFMAE